MLKKIQIAQLISTLKDQIRVNFDFVLSYISRFLIKYLKNRKGKFDFFLNFKIMSKIFKNILKIQHWKKFSYLFNSKLKFIVLAITFIN